MSTIFIIGNSSLSDTDFYKIRLHDLGYENENGVWRCKRRELSKSHLYDLKLNIFVYSFYLYVIEEKKQSLLAHENNDNNNRELNIAFARMDNCDIAPLMELRDSDLTNNIASEELRIVTSPGSVSRQNNNAEVVRDNIRYENHSSPWHGERNNSEHNNKGIYNCGVTETQEEIMITQSLDAYFDENNNDNMPRSQNTWMCTTCTFYNDLMVGRCDVCGNRRRISSIGNSGSESNGAAACVGIVDYLVQDISLRRNNNCNKQSGSGGYNYDTGRQSIGNACRFEDGDSSHVIDASYLEIPSETWKCGGCKNDNFLGTNICSEFRKYAPFFRKWVCDRCSFFNDELSLQCGACGETNFNVSRGCETCNTKVAEHVSTQLECIGFSQRTECLTCSNGINASDKMCKKCIIQSYYCTNRWCGAINSNNLKYCRQCKLKQGSNITDYNMFDVHDGDKDSQRWQCTFCGLFNSLRKCSKCRNMRCNPLFKKCSCNWVNRPNVKQCEKCLAIFSLTMP